MKTLLALCLVLSGCAHGLDISLMDEPLTIMAPQQPKVADVRFWLDTKLWKQYGAASDRAVVMLKVMGYNMIQTYNRADGQITIVPATADLCADGRIATTYETCGDIRLCVGHRQLDATAIAHEMSHALGVGHISGGPAVMNPTHSTVTAFTVLDVSAFQKRTDRWSIWATYNGQPMCAK